jgi:hypothetical protein
MEQKKRISQPVYLNLEEELKSWRKLLNIKEKPKDDSENEKGKESENKIEIIFLKKENNKN